MSGKIRAGIIGGAGYTAGELLRLLIYHPEVEIVFVNSQSNADKDISEVHTGLTGETDIKFSKDYDLSSIDVLFLCSGHNESTKFWQNNLRPTKLKVIDLAQDFRDESEGYVYGLPELNIHRLEKAVSVANPGCFATAIQLSLLPLAKAGLLKGDIQITGVTGSTGAGVKPSATTHFSYRNNNLSVYKPFTHQHLMEITRNIHGLQPDFTGKFNFIPVRGDFARGIFAMVWMDTDLTQTQITDIYKDYYKDAPFTVVTDRPVDLKQAVNTNKAIINPQVVEGRLLVTVAIDNLLKGASGQAVQNMNIIFGLDQTTGLKLKPSGF